MTIRVGHKLAVLAVPVMLFFALQMLDEEIVFRRVTLIVFMVFELAIASLLRPSSWKQLALYLALFVCLWAIWRIPFTSRKAFLLQFQEISVGDRLTTVRTKLGGYELHFVEDDGTSMRIQVLHWEVSGDVCYNADVAEIYLKNGLVTEKEFHPD